MIDLVCWDFGDTLVDESFMRIAPPGVPGWSAAYERCFNADPTYADRLDLGQTTLHELIQPLAARLAMTPAQIARHLRSVWTQIRWFPAAEHWVSTLDGKILQAVVTVNPTEFSGIAVACELDQLVDVIVTSADVGSLSKPVMARRARELLGLPDGLETTLLIDNKSHNTDAFEHEGGQVFLFRPIDHAVDAEGELAAVLARFVSG